MTPAVIKNGASPKRDRSSTTICVWRLWSLPKARRSLCASATIQRIKCGSYATVAYCSTRKWTPAWTPVSYRIVALQRNVVIRASNLNGGVTCKNTREAESIKSFRHINMHPQIVIDLILDNLFLSDNSTSLYFLFRWRFTYKVQQHLL